ncbi:MAG: hypothetical protein ACE5QW_07275 [Thermoplasmata archaeon]
MTKTIAVSDDIHNQLKLVKTKEGFRSMDELIRHLLRDHQRHAIREELTPEEIETMKTARDIMRNSKKLLKLLE